MTPFEPHWYKAELARAAAEEQRKKTWGHPMDLLLAIAFVVVLTCLFVGVFG